MAKQTTYSETEASTSRELRSLLNQLSKFNEDKKPEKHSVLYALLPQETDSVEGFTRRFYKTLTKNYRLNATPFLYDKKSSIQGLYRFLEESPDLNVPISIPYEQMLPETILKKIISHNVSIYLLSKI